MQPLDRTTLSFVLPPLSLGSYLSKNSTINFILGSIKIKKDKSFFGKTVTEYETELMELAEFVPEVVNFKEYLCSKFEEGLNLEVWEKMYISGNQSYKKVV